MTLLAMILIRMIIPSLEPQDLGGATGHTCTCTVPEESHLDGGTPMIDSWTPLPQRERRPMWGRHAPAWTTGGDYLLGESYDTAFPPPGMGGM